VPDPVEQLPLKPVELLILTMLAAGDRHGYGIRQDILDHTEGKVEIEAGNLYRHIRALEDEGFVTDAPAPRRETDERRIYYRLTPQGKRVLAAEMLRLRTLVRLAEQRGIIAPLPARA
jgi:DNA-binding PadR family transcriptional regulator